MSVLFCHFACTNVCPPVSRHCRCLPEPNKPDCEASGQPFHHSGVIAVSLHHKQFNGHRSPALNNRAVVVFFPGSPIKLCDPATLPGYNPPPNNSCCGCCC